MGTESGWNNQKQFGSSKFKTISNLGSDQYGAPGFSKGLYPLAVAAAIIASAVDTDKKYVNIEFTGHNARVGDVFAIRSGNLISWEFQIANILDANIFQIYNVGTLNDGTTAAIPLAADTAQVMRWVTPQLDSSGNIVVAPAAGGATSANQVLQITQETSINTVLGNQADSAASSDTGTFSIIAFIKRSMQNWTSLLAKLPALVAGRIPVDGSGVTQPISAASLPLPSGAATSAKQDSLLTELLLKAKLTDTQPVSLASVPLPTGAATSALQTAEATLIGAVTETAPASDTASSGLNGRLQRLAQNISALILQLPTTIGQKARASSFSVSLATEQEAQVGIVTETAPASDTASSGLNGRLQRIAQRITSLIALLPASLGQKTMAASLAVTLASDQTVISVNDSTTVAGTVTSAQVTVGTSVVRATVAGTAPSASRKRLMIKPSKNNTGAIYLGASGVTTANGLEIIGPDRLEFEFDSGDYYLISDTAAQSVEILEKV